MTGSDSSAVIALEGLSKTFRGKVRALDGIDLTIAPGETFGLLGPNGAGKSTLVKILMTVIRPTKGRGTLLGAPIGSKGALARVGYLPEHHQFPSYLTGRQVVDFFGRMHLVEREARRRRTEMLLDLVGMLQWSDRRIRTYSKGMRQRVGVAQALVNDPDLVLLDEPTDGVDPVGRRDIRDIIKRINAEGKTVFINSHLLSELEMVCSRVAILVQGKVRAHGTIDDLTAGQRQYEIAVASEAGAIAEALGDVVSPRLAPGSQEGRGEAKLAGGETVVLEENRVRVQTGEAEVIQPVLDRLRASSLVIRHVQSMRPSLEDLFMQAVTDPATGETLQVGAASARRQDAHDGGDA